jgi:3-hydroxymyristoyl/3-hydroxydecanoyl-(acyl carrier protein) dehydratase
MRFLFVDRIMELSPGKYARGVKHVTADDAYLCKDREGKLCFIPSLIGETLGQLAAWNVMLSNDFTRRPVAGIASKARLIRPAYVGETLLLESFIDSLDDSAVQYHSIARVGDEIIFTLDGALGPLLPMADFIEADEVRQQFNELDRPGRWPPATTLGQTAASTNGPIRIAPMTFDRIIACEPGATLSAEKCITRAAPYFPDHFPKKPVLPMTVLLECKLNLAYEFVKRSNFNKAYQVSELRRIKMSGFILPGDVIVCHLQVKQETDNELILNYRTEVEGKRVCVLELLMTTVGIANE